jgi:hypothetical protein
MEIVRDFYGRKVFSLSIEFEAERGFELSSETCHPSLAKVKPVTTPMNQAEIIAKLQTNFNTAFLEPVLFTPAISAKDLPE